MDRTFPDDVLGCIFRYLTIPETRRIAQINKIFLFLCNKTLQRVTTASSRFLDANGTYYLLNAVADKCPKIRKLSLGRHGDLQDIRKVIMCCEKIEEIGFYCTNITTNQNLLALVSRYGQNLKTIKVWSFSQIMKPDSLRCIGNNCKNIERLELNDHCSHDINYGFDTLLKNCPKLKTLKLKDFLGLEKSLEDIDFQCESLQAISLVRCGLSDIICEVIANNMTNATAIDLRGNIDITDEGIEKLFCCDLEELHIDGTAVTISTIVALSTRDKLPNLKKLGISKKYEITGQERFRETRPMCDVFSRM